MFDKSVESSLKKGRICLKKVLRKFKEKQCVNGIGEKRARYVSNKSCRKCHKQKRVPLGCAIHLGNT